MDFSNSWMRVSLFNALADLQQTIASPTMSGSILLLVILFAFRVRLPSTLSSAVRMDAVRRVINKYITGEYSHCLITNIQSQLPNPEDISAGEHEFLQGIGDQLMKDCGVLVLDCTRKTCMVKLTSLSFVFF